MEGDHRKDVAFFRPYISIHTLRVEGDSFSCFLSIRTFPISIHTLRVEGDLVLFDQIYKFYISIHTLRVEGD